MGRACEARHPASRRWASLCSAQPTRYIFLIRPRTIGLWSFRGHHRLFGDGTRNPGFRTDDRDQNRIPGCRTMEQARSRNDYIFLIRHGNAGTRLCATHGPKGAWHEPCTIHFELRCRTINPGPRRDGARGGLFAGLARVRHGSRQALPKPAFLRYIRLAIRGLGRLSWQHR